MQVHYFSCEDGGSIIEAGAGWYGKIRWESSKGAVFKTDESFTPWVVSTDTDKLPVCDNMVY